MSSIGIILSGGVGSRFGAEIPKQYNLIKNRMIIEYVVDAFKSSWLDEIVVVCSEEFADLVQSKCAVKTIKSGRTRAESARNAIDYVIKNTNHDKLFFCDAVRPILDPENINYCIDKLDEFDSVVAISRINCSLGSNNNLNVDRSQYFLIDGPEAFRLEAVRNYDATTTASAICQWLPTNKKVLKTDIFVNCIKITYEHDLFLAEALINAKRSKKIETTL